MKLTEVWKTKEKPTISFELYPARTEKAAEKLENTIDILADLHPDFVAVTFGAGGSTREGSYNLLKKMIEEDIQNGFAPIMVNLTAGTTVLGAFDPIRSVRQVCDDHGVWLHVDGAYCGSVIFSEKYKHLVDGLMHATKIRMRQLKTTHRRLAQPNVQVAKHRGNQNVVGFAGGHHHRFGARLRHREQRTAGSLG